MSAAELDFGDALAYLRKGSRMARAGWNGKGMWLLLVPGEEWARLSGGDTAQAYRLGLDHAPFIGMRTADGKFVPWLASQTDMLAEDWEVVT